MVPLGGEPDCDAPINMTRYRDTENGTRESRLVVLGVLAAGVILVQSILGILIYRGLQSWPDRGTFGDMFGAVNTLFSGLAFAGVVYAILLQRKELALQRRELELTRAELKRTARAQEKSERAFSRQVYLMALAALVSARVETKKTFDESLEKSRQGMEELERILELTRPEELGLGPPGAVEAGDE